MNQANLISTKNTAKEDRDYLLDYKSIDLIGLERHSVLDVPVDNVSRDEALAEARASGLDLVLVAPDAEPPVCKVMDYGKHLFELKKSKAAQRKKQKQIQVKEVKFRPGTEEGDYQVKLRNLKRFLEEGDKAKVSLRFRGREVVHPEIGMTLMNRIAEDLDELGQIETEPKFEGRQVIMVLAPRKKKKG